MHACFCVRSVFVCECACFSWSYLCVWAPTRAGHPHVLRLDGRTQPAHCRHSVRATARPQAVQPLLVPPPWRPSLPVCVSPFCLCVVCADEGQGMMLGGGGGVDSVVLVARASHLVVHHCISSVLEITVVAHKGLTRCSPSPTLHMQAGPPQDRQGLEAGAGSGCHHDRCQPTGCVTAVGAVCPLLTLPLRTWWALISASSCKQRAPNPANPWRLERGRSVTSPADL